MPSALDLDRVRTLVLIARELRKGSQPRPNDPFDEYIGVRWEDVPDERVAEVRGALAVLRGEVTHHRSGRGSVPDLSGEVEDGDVEPTHVFGWEINGPVAPNAEQVSRAQAFRAFFEARSSGSTEDRLRYALAGRLINAFEQRWVTVDEWKGSSAAALGVTFAKRHPRLPDDRCGACGELIVPTATSALDVSLVHGLTRQAACPVPPRPLAELIAEYGAPDNGHYGVADDGDASAAARTGWPENNCPRIGCEQFHSGIPHTHPNPDYAASDEAPTATFPRVED